MEKEPRISVIIPVHNRAEMLGNAVESVLSQTYRNFELIVVDDGSTEDLSYVKKLVASSGNKMIRIEHAGVAAARNQGVKLSSGEWLSFLDSDDIWLPHKLQQQIDFHESNPNIVVSQCAENWFRHGRRVNKPEKHHLASGKIFSRSVEHCCISSSSVMISREIFEEFCGFDSRYPVCEDYDLWLRLTLCHEVGAITEPLVDKFGGHDDQLSKSLPAMDRYRLFSLLSLLVTATLSDSEQALVVTSAKKRTEILLSGARKRDSEVVILYELVLRAIDRKIFNSELLEQVSPIISTSPQG